MDSYRLPDEYEPTFITMMKKVAETSGLRETLFTSFWPMRGHRYHPDTGFFLIGRAVRGWTTGYTQAELQNDHDLQKLVYDTRQASESVDGHCPMKWVTDQAKDERYPDGRGVYNTNRSPFWRMAKRTLRFLQGNSYSETDWSSHLVWSNLYKVSPQQRENEPVSTFKGNPSDGLCRAQCPHAANLLNMELAAFRPRRILVLTGLGWFDDPACGDFKRRLSVELIEGHRGKYVDAVGHRPGEVWVIAQHPQGKAEDPFHAEVASAFLSDAESYKAYDPIRKGGESELIKT